MSTKRWLGSGLRATACASIVGCGTLIPTSMLTNGEIEPFRVRNGELRGPWDGASEDEGVIPARKGSRETPEETFLLTLDRGFLKYLPDLAGVNEVVIVFTFEDTPMRKDEDKIVKIIGPMLQQPDGAWLPEFSKICFGPTALRGRYLTVSIDVYEFDRGEADDTAALLDFIGDATRSLAIADPVTAAEIRVVKEIGKALARTNQDDLVLHTSFDLLPYEESARAFRGECHTAALPLRVGHFGLVKTERPFALFTFFPATRRLEFRGGEPWTCVGNGLAFPIALAIDLVALPITGFMRGLTDVPDTESMAPLEWRDGRLAENSVWLDGTELRFDPATRLLVRANDGQPYRAKSWITFSISAGHEAIPEELRGQLTESEKKLAEAQKTGTLRELLEGGELAEAIEALTKAKELAAAAAAASGFALVSPRLGFFDDERAVGETRNELVVEIATPKQVEVLGFDLAAKRTAIGTSFAAVAGTEVSTLTTARSVKFSAEGGFPLGEYELAVRYRDKEGSARLARFDLTAVRKPVLTLSADGKAPWKNGATIEPLDKTAGDYRHVRAFVIEFEAGAHEPVRIENVAGTSDGIGDDEFAIENTFADGLRIRSITVKRRGDLSDVVVTNDPPK